MNTRNDNAQNHYDFLKKVMSHANVMELSIVETFGYGEDDFIVRLFSYSDILQSEINKLNIKNVSWISSELSVVIDELAIAFWQAVETENSIVNEAKLPDENEFEQLVKRLLLPYRQDLH